MTTLAILDDQLPRQLDENPSALEGIEVLWCGTDAAELERRIGSLRPTILAVNLELLGVRPTEVLQRLVDRGRSELVLALYTFAKRELLRSLAANSRPLRAPVTLERLRTQMMSVLVRQAFDTLNAPGTASSATVDPVVTTGADPRPALGRERRFSRAQLARLMEISSSLDCECPNHLSELVQSLGAFEDYAARCENRNDADAEVHRMLYERTGEARAVMEQALQALLEYERIVV